MKTMKLLIFVIVLIIGNGNCNPCEDIERLDITSGEVSSNGSVIHEGIEYEDGTYWSTEENNETVIYGCPCIKRKCLWKCCGANMMYQNNTCTSTDERIVNPFNPPVYDEKVLLPEFQAKDMFFYMSNRLCTFRSKVSEGVDKLYLQQDGRLIIANSYGGVSRYPLKDFCLEMSGVVYEDSLENINLSAVLCLHDDGQSNEVNMRHLTYGICMAILSIPSLVATFLVYSCLPELRNVHGKCLLAYCGGIIIGYSVLIYSKIWPFTTGTDKTNCYIIAFVAYYSFQTSFFWLNVMCFDIWKTFSGMRTADRQRQTRRFIRYGVYAWGVPLLLAAITAVMQFSNNLPDYIVRPRITEVNCWFPDWKSQLAYFYSSVLILVVCNITFFSITAYHIQTTCNETKLLNAPDSSRNMANRLHQQKERFLLYVKLFIIMGVNWTLELISFATGVDNWFMFLVDVSNISVGLSVFFVFVVKNKVFMRKWVRFWGKDMGLGDSSTSRYTHSSTATTELTRVNGT